MTTPKTLPWQAAQDVITAEDRLTQILASRPTENDPRMQAFFEREYERNVAGAEASLRSAQQHLAAVAGDQAETELANRRAYLAERARAPRRPLFG